MNMEDIDNDKLTPADIPPFHADWGCIEKFALKYSGYERQGSLKACGDIANARLNNTLTELRTCLFFEQRRSRHTWDYSSFPDKEFMLYIWDIIERIRAKVVAGDFL